MHIQSPLYNCHVCDFIEDNWTIYERHNCAEELKKQDVTHGDYYVPWDEIYLEDLLRGQPEELIGWQKMPAVPTKEAIIEFLKKAGRSFERPSDYKKRLPPWEL